MHLNRIAQRALNEPMDAWDEATQSFVPGAFLGRIEISDRFLSNFNKPLRRRMMFTAPDVVFPDSRTFRHPGTGDVYLIGQSRQDALAGNPHIQLTVCQLVTDTPRGSSGLATLYRKAPVGPPSEPGWLVEQEVTKAFMDLEFRTSAAEADTYEIVTENFFAFLPQHVICQPWDFLELHGSRYRVVDVFADSGLAGLRIDRTPDVRIDFVLHRQGGKTYNRDTQEYELEATTHNVTGVLLKYYDFPSWNSDADPYIDVSIEADHIGFRPQADVMSLEFDGRRRVIKQVFTQPGERQYRLRCA